MVVQLLDGDSRACILNGSLGWAALADDGVDDRGDDEQGEIEGDHRGAVIGKQ